MPANKRPTFYPKAAWYHEVSKAALYDIIWERAMLALGFEGESVEDASVMIEIERMADPVLRLRQDRIPWIARKP